MALWFDGAVPNESLAERLTSKSQRLSEMMIIVCVVLSCWEPVMDNVDIGWAVAQGRWMVEHGAIYRQDAFNYPNLGHALVNEYPLFELVLYAVWSVGWWGPCAFATAMYVSLFAVLIHANRGSDVVRTTGFIVALGAALLFIHVGALLRPHMVTYLAIVVLGVFLLRQRNAKSWTNFWPMALLQIAWTNCHSGFVIGPAMVGLFGAEMSLRRAITERAIPWSTIKTWAAAFALILLACFVNPFGAARFHPPFYQDQLESIRAYVGEMEPLDGGVARIFDVLTMFAVVFAVMGGAKRRGEICWSFALLALLFLFEAQSVKKAWPVLGLFLPLLTISFGDSSPARSQDLITARKITRRQITVLNFIPACVLAIALYGTVTALPAQWHELENGNSELSRDAVAWMKAHEVEGRLFHRDEDGGWLQEEGFNHGETFSDTGFGKFDEAFIHEVGLVSERPALVPRFLTAYHPDFTVCSTFCYQWPYYLRQSGWRLIFYSPNSAVWARPGARPDLPTVPDAEVESSFQNDLAQYGRPSDTRLFGRNIIALNSMGLADFAFGELTRLPKELHHAGWYWEAARFLCFAEPPLPPARCDALLTEAEQLHDDATTAEFRAYAHDARGDPDGALRILQSIRQDHLGNYAAELLLKIELDRGVPEALPLARRTDCFDLRNGRHWQYLAEAEERAGHIDRARAAWKKAVFYFPDDAALMATASKFADTYHDAEIARAIAESTRVYGQ